MRELTEIEIVASLKAVGFNAENIAFMLSNRHLESPKLRWLLKLAHYVELDQMDVVAMALSCPWLNVIHEKHHQGNALNELRVRILAEQAQLAMTDMYAKEPLEYVAG